MTEVVMEKRLLYPQTVINKTQINYWENHHNNIQKMLNIHNIQGSKTDIFPFDLAYMITNKWNLEENKSFMVDCKFSDFDTDESINNMKEINQKKIKNTRKIIHDRLQYLLEIHKSKDITKPYPLDLVYMLDMDTYYFLDALKYDKEYDYQRKYEIPYYNDSTVFYLNGLISKDNKSLSQYRFYDVEKDDLNIEHLKMYIKCDYMPDFVPDDYLLWKSALNDNKYDYIRIHNKSFYDADMYLPLDDDSYNDYDYGYVCLNDYVEPKYNEFNHFTDIKFDDLCY